MNQEAGINNISTPQPKINGLDIRVFYLLLSVIGPFIVYTVSAIWSDAVLWGMSFSDVLDLVILGPFFALMVALIWQAFHKVVLDGTSLIISLKTRIVGFVSLFLFFEGHAMHFTANALDNYAKKILDNPESVPDDLMNLIHFLDEFLGHALVFTGLFGLILTGVLIERETIMMTVTKKEITITSVVGFFMGSLVAISTIEATYFIGFSLVSAVIAIILLLKEKPFQEEYWESRPFGLTALFLSIGVITAAMIYFITIGGFTPPSEL